MEEVIYSLFDITLAQLFFRIYGGSAGDLREEWYWKHIQRLKKLAQNELDDSGVEKEE